jgi:hypothetical protein
LDSGLCVEVPAAAAGGGKKVVAPDAAACDVGEGLFKLGYIHSTNPAPDEDTLLTLIETNDEISVAVSQQQRLCVEVPAAAVGGGKKVVAPDAAACDVGEGLFKFSGSTTTGRYEYNSEDFQVRNPFADDYATNDSDQAATGAGDSGLCVEVPAAAVGGGKKVVAPDAAACDADMNITLKISRCGILSLMIMLRMTRIRRGIGCRVIRIDTA